MIDANVIASAIKQHEDKYHISVEEFAQEAMKRSNEPGTKVAMGELLDELADLRARLTEVEGERDEAHTFIREVGAVIKGIKKDAETLVSDFTQTRAALAEMTERAKVLGEAIIMVHKSPNGYPGCNCMHQCTCACVCPACTIAREVIKP